VLELPSTVTESPEKTLPDAGETRAICAVGCTTTCTLRDTGVDEVYWSFTVRLNT